MKIRVKEPSIGECLVTSFNDIDKDTQYLIKALSGLQIICMNANEDPDKHKELISILKEAAEKANKLFNEDINEVNINVTELFN